MPRGPSGESIHVFQGRRYQTSPVEEYSSRADGPPPGGPEFTHTGLPGHRLPGFASSTRGGRPKPLWIQDFSAQAIMRGAEEVGPAPAMARQSVQFVQRNAARV